MPVAEIADDRRFENLAQIWLSGDHYKWRAMRAAGVPERYCTGDASDEEKFQKWAETVPQTLRNPLYHWTQGGHYNALLGVQGFFAVLSGTGLRVYPVKRSAFYTEQVVPYLRTVWQHVLDDTPPPIDASDAARQYAVDAHPPREETTDLSPEAEALAADVARWGDVEKDADTRKREASTRLLAALAGAKWGIGRQWKVTRVDRADDRLDIKRLRAEMPDVVRQFTTPSKPTAYPLVRRVKGDG